MIPLRPERDLNWYFPYLPVLICRDSVLLYGYRMGMEPFFIVRWGTVGVQGKIKTLGTLKFPGLNGGEAGV